MGGGGEQEAIAASESHLLPQPTQLQAEFRPTFPGSPTLNWKVEDPVRTHTQSRRPLSRRQGEGECVDSHRDLSPGNPTSDSVHRALSRSVHSSPSRAVCERIGRREGGLAKRNRRQSTKCLRASPRFTPTPVQIQPQSRTASITPPPTPPPTPALLAAQRPEGQAQLSRRRSLVPPRACAHCLCVTA